MSRDEYIEWSQREITNWSNAGDLNQDAFKRMREQALDVGEHDLEAGRLLMESEEIWKQFFESKAKLARYLLERTEM
jgi:hypothetical protein